MGLGDVLGGIGEFLHRPHGAAGHPPSRNRGEHDTGKTEEEEAGSQAGEERHGLREVSRHLHGDPGRHGPGEHPVGRALHNDIPDHLGTEALGHIAVDGLHGKRDVRVADPDDGFGEDELHDDVLLDQLASGALPLTTARAASREPPVDLVDVEDLDESGGGTAPTQEIVHLAARPIACECVCHGGHDRHPDRDRDRDQQRDAGAETHGSRATYPTPLTVWISRGSPPSSVFRRRYPM